MIYEGKKANLYIHTYSKLQNYDDEVNLIKSIINDNLINDSYILDIGCGPGLHLTRLTDSVNTSMNFIGIDASEVLVKDASINTDDKCTIIKSNLTKLWPFKTGSIDLAYATYNIYQSFISEIEISVFLAELKRVIKKDGMFIADIHNEAVYSKNFPKGYIKQWNLDKVVCSHFQKINTDGRTKTISLYFTSKDGRWSLNSNHLLRIMTPDCFLKEMFEHDFKVITKFGSWKGDIFDPNTSQRLVCLFSRF